ncbi:MAG TPA: RluA family pseudouridine synthase [Myxococcales bacterium]|nr:RluA family pseudouridine synthase [Myxococcales bacterium]
MKVVRLRVEAAEAGTRLDQLLAARLPELSRSRLQRLIRDESVRIAGRAAKASVRPGAGAEIEVRIPAPRPTELAAESLELPVLFEDPHLLVIDKPAGIAVHPGAGTTSGTVVHGLLHQVRDLVGIGGELRPGIVHRLDKDTSGCLVVAKTEPALRGLQAEFKSRRVEKRYLALVHGAPRDEGELDTAYGRHPKDRKRFSSRVKEGRRAVTRWRVIGRGAGVSLVGVELLTGRTHQIRAHFADAGFPLLGDALYGGRKREARMPESAPARRASAAIGRQALHAALLAFTHPITQAPLRCEAPVPADFRAALRELGISAPRIR